MNLRTVALKIPPIIRSQRLLTQRDPILNAIPVMSNDNMSLLAEVWYTYIEPNGSKGYCPVCLQNIRNNFLSLRPVLIDLENESTLLNSIQ